MTLGTQLCLPGQFFAKSQAGPPYSAYGKQLVELMSTLQLILPRDPRKFNKALQTCTHELVKNDAIKSLLGRAFTSSYKVVNKELKLFTFDFGHKYEIVLVYRLKAVHLLFNLNQVDKSQSDTCKPKIDFQVFLQSLTTTPIRILS